MEENMRTLAKTDTIVLTLIEGHNRIEVTGIDFGKFKRLTLGYRIKFCWALLRGQHL